MAFLFYVIHHLLGLDNSSMTSDLAFWIYNAKDSLVLHEIYQKLHSDLLKRDNLEAYQHQVRLIEPLVYMTTRGIRMDLDGMQAASRGASSELLNLTQEIADLTKGIITNPNSTKQLKEYFYVHKNIQPYVSRTTGNISVDESALKRLAKGTEGRSGLGVAKLLLRVRHLAKLKGTYLDMKMDDDGRLRSSFNPVGTVSGRISSSKTIFGTGMNAQTMPPAMRKFMLADEGYVLYNVDLSQAENRVVAYIAPEPLMIDAFESGTDIHAQTGGLISNLTLSEVIQQDGDKTPCDIGGGQFTWRFWGKKANHGLNYGLGYRNFALLYEITEKEAKFIIEKYHAAYPGVRKYHSWIKEQLSKDRTLENCYGRKRKFMDRWGDSLFKAAYDFPPQSTVAEKINREGVCEIYYNQQTYRPIDLLLQVHDSISFQISIHHDWKTHADCLSHIKESLERPLQWKGREFIIPAELKMGFNLYDMQEVDWASNIEQNLMKTYKALRVQEAN